ncbi:phosphatidylinositol phospholipase C [Talaromyces stipitatus ATCC 10500]|uniref:Phosphatidylinositol phospholipase C n=1 Tax=Talaromyces stipitatus (strain ATCC 10500 / CBS 375.48 / QM 6759 / NRRL 1006) TaxID=441959 RepID=B8LWE5_TALSN|nr:phosphatidylinositol phospholipase C [Talaromyces stipitatus ATCC 10500]EED24256.1 phosphatidylinositol phospholipase C [Talaromyces stipitatus ATCC 10500]
MAQPLTIRNLTSTPLELKTIERFPPQEKRKEDGIQAFGTMAKNFTRMVTDAATNVTRASNTAQPLPPDAQPFAHQDVSIRIDPFGTNRTDVKTFENDDKERLRLTFEVDDNPRHRFTGVYVTQEGCLAIFSSAQLNAWMRELRDDTMLSSLSIPGTHNSPTCHVAPPSVRCQAASPKEQLENGVRFFDIRVQPQYPEDPSRDELILVHSAFPISLTGNKYFRDLFNVVNEFLDRNPSETLIISLKREGTGKATDEQLSRIIRDHYATPESRWYTDPRMPTLGEVRGKVVLVRRYNIDEPQKEEHEGRGFGIDGSGWADNTPNATCPGGELCIQDFYEVLETQNIDKKIQYVNEHIARAGAARYPFGRGDPNQKYPFFVNFLSASNFWKTQTWPEKIAAKLNPATVKYLCLNHCDHPDGDWGTGTLVTDWVGLDGDWDLVRCIVGMNAKLKLREN